MSDYFPDRGCDPNWYFRKPQAEWVQSVAQLDFYTFFRKLLKQISFLYFPDRGCDPARVPVPRAEMRTGTIDEK